MENEIEKNKNSPTNEKPLSLPVSPDGAASNDAENDIYEAVYPYEATDASDLSFDVGECITVIKRDGDWWTGRIGDRTGTFPSNYVQKVEYIQETAIATTAYQATEDDHLSFEQGQTIYITKKDDRGFYQGEIHVYLLSFFCNFNSFFSLFYSFLINQYVSVGFRLIMCKYKQPIHQHLHSIIIHQVNKCLDMSIIIYIWFLLEFPQYMAIFPYDAQQDDELSFPADAILEILDHANASGWFKARLGDQVGLIPSTYVQPIDTHHQRK
jgi:hypothetical protein